ncbi:MAG: PKD domain-containing protein, partial [Cryomorphaceae bacterium]
EYANYEMGEDIRTPPIRSLSNPNLRQCADTYQGDFWVFGSFNNGGVHFNSGVQNFWFYLLVEGGTGTNDNGDDYAVQSIGLEAAAAIAFRNLTVYLTPNSQYIDSRTFSIQSAIDLYGECSDEVVAVTNAWQAVGVGEVFDNAVIANFDTSSDYYCQVPATINFSNLSSNASTYFWTFGDGSTSTEENPSHTYNATGQYTVTLEVSGDAECSDGDTLELVNLVTVTNQGGPPTPTCTPNPTIQNSQSGIAAFELSDIVNSSGAADEGCEDFSCTHTTELTEGTLQTLTAELYGSAYLHLWIDLDADGSFSTDEKVYTSTVLTNFHDVDFVVPGGPITDVPLRLRVIASSASNAQSCAIGQFGQAEDYTIILLGNEAPPVANFNVADQSIQPSETIQFNDLSINLPDTWQWYFEGGSPETSTEQYPNVQYNSEGTFDVELIVANAFGSDTLLMTDYISVVSSINMCDVSSTTAVSGNLYDSGGPEGNYSDNEFCTLLISPGCAQSITLSFDQFQLEGCCDFFRVYDGSDDSGELLLSANGSNTPADVTAESGEMFIRFSSDFSVTYSGWVATWTSETPNDNPVAEFMVSDENPALNQAVQFSDASTNFPATWLWDFGDGFTSIEQNPSHAFTSAGTYEVSMIVGNCFGFDTTSVEISVQEAPEFDIAPLDSLALSLGCGDSVDTTFYLINNGSGDLIVSPSGSSGIFSNAPDVLALTAFALEPNYQYTIESITEVYEDFNLFETDAVTPEELAIALEGKDIVYIPSQNGPSVNFLLTAISEQIEDFVENGGKLLISGSLQMEIFDFFPLTDYFASISAGMEVSDISHPINQNISESFLSPSFTYGYDWSQSDAISPIVIYSELPNYAAVAETNYGDGKIVYCGFNYADSNLDSDRLLGNSMKYLANFNEGDLIDSLSLTDQIIINPGDSLEVYLSVNAEGAAAGNYYTDINFQTNDPENALVNYVIAMEVSGEPLPSISTQEIIFTPIFNGQSVTDTLIITNEGCEILAVDAALPDGFFSISNNQFDVEAFSSVTVFVTYAPLESGDHTAVIEVVTNAGDFSIALSASAQGAPTISVTPENPSVDATACADSVLVTFDVSNAGESLLEFTIGDKTVKTLEDILLEINNNHEAITNLIPDIFFFTGGESGDNIIDGGGDMYDGGNFLTTNFQSVPYTSGIISESSAFGEGSRYFTRKVPGLFVLAADMSDVDLFRISGDLGADGTGTREGGDLDYTFGGMDYKCFYTNTLFTGDPTVNHLIIVEDSPGLNHEFFPETLFQFHTVSGLNNANRVYFLLFAGSSFSTTETATVQNIFETFVEDFVYDVGFQSEAGYEAEPGDTAVVELYLPVSGLDAGSYEFPIQIFSNAPGNSNLIVPVTVEVGDTPCSFFEAFVDENTCSGTVQFENQSTNSADSITWDFGDGNISTEENPFHGYAEAGNYTVTLTVCADGVCSSSEQTVEILETSGPVTADCQPSAPDFNYEIYLLQNSINDVISPFGQSGQGVQDLTCEVFTELFVGEENTFEALFYSEFPSNFLRAEIDFNGDGIFTPDEFIFSGYTAGSVDTNFVVPPGTLLNQPLRYRLLISNTFINDCSLDFGRVRDLSIVVLPVTEAPEADFEWEALDECQRVYRFSDNSSNVPTDWSWNFGDGNSSSEQNPIHTFEESGDFE